MWNLEKRRAARQQFETKQQATQQAARLEWEAVQKEQEAAREERVQALLNTSPDVFRRMAAVALDRAKRAVKLSEITAYYAEAGGLASFATMLETTQVPAQAQAIDVELPNQP